MSLYGATAAKKENKEEVEKKKPVEGSKNVC